jgi:hypothetical protein
VLLANIPAKFSLVWAASASPSFVRQVPAPSQQNITPGAASLTDGFPPLNFVPVTAGGIPPFGQDMNGILQQITQWAQWQATGTPPKWDSTFEGQIGGYPVGAVLQQAVAGGAYWINTVDGNATNPDPSGGTGWTSWTPSNQNAVGLEFVLGDGVTPLQVGTQTWLEIPFACTIQRWTVLADQSGSIDLNVWKAPYSSYPPTSGNSITGGSDPNLSSAVKSQSATPPPSWTTSVSAGDIIKVNVASATNVTRVTLSLFVLKS